MKDEKKLIVKDRPSDISIDYSLPVSIQSANTFFHFMNKGKYLHEILVDKKIYPRYCIENLSFLDIDIKSVGIAMKCFCNIPLHLVSNHKDEYGFYCIGLTKEWGIRTGLQPVIYYNRESYFPKALKISYESAMKYFDDDQLEGISEILNHNLKFIKPVIGIDEKIHKIKDFTDEKEWRYVPEIENLDFGEVIVEQGAIRDKNIMNGFSETIKREGYCLKLEYDDIKYLFVKKDSYRKTLIKVIKDLECSQDEKNKLITKICVWDEMDGDF